jgi:hypothetical protein
MIAVRKPGHFHPFEIKRRDSHLANKFLRFSVGKREVLELSMAPYPNKPGIFPPGCRQSASVK